MRPPNKVTFYLTIWITSQLSKWGLPLVLGDQVLSRVVNTKYGRIQGAIRHHVTPSLPPIEIFLGVPYASPPTGEGRFTPTSSPLPWDSVKRCLELPPVCPQPMPDVGYPGGTLPPDRLAYLKNLRPLLQRQSEDCLYLNIYTPHDGGGQYPVMVFIQGETFWWGSGNLYDGGVLASYGQVVVVTINYRLGPLGFLNTSPAGSTRKVVGNQGLMDQLAALSWVHENIAYFGGDSSRVTLFGHAAGAACISYLMVSPVLVPGLFHRAILMSGSAFSEWAEVEDGISVTARLAKVLNCSLPSDLSDQHPETIVCLRNLSAQALVNAPMPRYKFAPLFGPSVDGVVITHDYRMRIARELKGRNLSIILGMTEGDAYPELTHRQAQEGLSIKERNRLFRTFVRNSYHHHLQEIFLAMVKEYTDWENPSHHPIEVRDMAVEALSDGAFVAPMARLAEVVSRKAETFMYVFAHHDRDHQRLGSVFASELALMFGAPFHDSTTYPIPPSSSPSNPSRSSSLLSYNPPSPSFGASFSSSSPGSSSGSLSRGDYSSLPSNKNVAWVAPSNFSRNDALVSEILMRLWTNFAKTGSPNNHDDTLPNLSYPERARFRNVTWGKYDPVYENYLEISSRPRSRDHYRAHKVALWNWLLPELQDAGNRYPEVNADDWYSADSPEYFIGPVRPLDPFRFLEPTEQTFTSPLPMLPSPHDEYLGPNVSAAHGKDLHPAQTKDNLEKNPLLDYTTALTLTVAIGLSLLVLNVILFAALLYRRDRNQMGAKINYDSVSVQPLCSVDSGLRSGGSLMIHDSITPPGKDMISVCTADIQVTELHTFPTPPDIGDRNTEVVTYTSASGSKRHGCSSMPTSQFVPPPPLLASTSAASQHTSQLEAEMSTSVGTAMGCSSGGVMSSPCSSSSCYPESNASQYRSEGVGGGVSHYPDVHRSGNAANQNFPVSVNSPQQSNSGGAAPGGSGGMNSGGPPPCAAGGTCQMTTQQGSNFPPAASNYCPPAQYCNEYPVTQYSSERYTGSPSQHPSASCQFSQDDSCTSFTNSPAQRQHTSVAGSVLGIRGGNSDNGGTRSATLNRTGQSSGGPNPSCLQGSRKPKPPPRDSSSGTGFATLPRQSSLDSSTHINA